VVVSLCLTDVGDDNIGIKSDGVVAGRTFATENILVTDCTFLRGQGVSIGSETFGGVRNVTVRNCNFDGTANGIRIKSQRGRGGIVENIRYEHINMKNVDPAIVFTCYYLTTSDGDVAQLPGKTTPIYRNIHINNLRAMSPKAAGIIIGLPESPITDVVFEDVRIWATTGLTVKNAKGIQFKDAQVLPTKGPPLITENAQIQGLENPASAAK
jgi:polygalacturonase